MYFLFGMLCLLNILDVILTVKIVRTGRGHEANGFMVWMISKLGLVPGLMVPKLVVLVWFGFLAVTMVPQVAAALFGLLILYVWVVDHNYTVWLKVKDPV